MDSEQIDTAETVEQVGAVCVLVPLLAHRRRVVYDRQVLVYRRLYLRDGDPRVPVRVLLDRPYVPHKVAEPIVSIAVGDVSPSLYPVETKLRTPYSYRYM